ncbi:hypothetical protein ACFC0N_19010 [Streptomyces zaomyceticus]|uniref:hypothetical protein n=1 Tax=Streptomyces zaomyceticus TaxID=68286 RepID=UPI0035DB9600
MGAELLSVRSLHGAPGRVGPRHDDGRVADAPVAAAVAVPTFGGAAAAVAVPTFGGAAAAVAVGAAVEVGREFAESADQKRPTGSYRW